MQGIDDAFAAAQEDVLAWCDQLHVDLSCSGSTATVLRAHGCGVGAREKEAHSTVAAL